MGTAFAVGCALIMRSGEDREPVGSVADLVALVERVEVTVVPVVIASFPARIAQNFARAPELLGMSDADAGFALCVWSGCLAVAKLISLKRFTGADSSNPKHWSPMYPWIRRHYAGYLNELCRDPLFALGARCAAAFKRGRGQPYSLRGLPKRSPLREQFA